MYTTWVTNWLDPGLIPVRVMLLALMFGSLVMSASLPEAFGDRGLAVGIAYAAMHVGRGVFAVLGLSGDPLQRNFERILVWCLVSGALAIAGGLAGDTARFALWLAAVLVDLLGGWVGFWIPVLGRSRTSDWTIDAYHISERTAAFILIALGESVVLIGATVAATAHLSGAEVCAFVLAFVGAVGLWWIYFDRSADDAADAVAHSGDAGRFGRSAYHLLHPIMVAGIIVTAAADERMLEHPTGPAETTTAWMVLGGAALFIAGHAAFKATVWHVVPWSRIVAVLVLTALGLVATSVDVRLLGALVVAVVVGVAVADRVLAEPEPAAAR